MEQFRAEGDRQTSLGNRHKDRYLDSGATPTVLTRPLQAAAATAKTAS